MAYKNIYAVFTYNHMALMSIKNRSHVNTSIDLTRADHFVYTIIYDHFYIYYCKLILMVRMRFEPVPYCLCV